MEKTLFQGLKTPSYPKNIIFFSDILTLIGFNKATFTLCGLVVLLYKIY